MFYWKKNQAGSKKNQRNCDRLPQISCEHKWKNETQNFEKQSFYKDCYDAFNWFNLCKAALK